MSTIWITAGAMPPTWYIAWVENSGAEGTFVTDAATVVFLLIPR